MSIKDEKAGPQAHKSDAAGSDDDLDQRLERLKSTLDKQAATRRTEDNRSSAGNNSGNRAGIGQAFRLSSEFIAGVVAGAGIGYLVDTFFGTSPWGLIVFLLLGFAAAVLNVMRAAGMVAESQMRLKPAKQLHNRPEDTDSDQHTEK